MQSQLNTRQTHKIHLKNNDYFSNFILCFNIVCWFFQLPSFRAGKVVARAEPFVPTNLYPIERLPNYFNRVVVLPSFYPDEFPAFNFCG